MKEREKSRKREGGRGNKKRERKEGERKIESFVAAEERKMISQDAF